MSQKSIRCAIYTRKSSEEGLDQSFNSLHAQREACEAFVLSQKHEGWSVLYTEYNDGGFSGGNMERPGLRRLLADIGLGRIDTVVVYKVDRLTRSLADFAKIVEQFDSKGVSFVSVTQQFNTTSSMGRLTLNVLLSFAQFEREVTGERIRDKVAASKKKGMWMGGHVPLGYDLANRMLVVNPTEADLVRKIFHLYVELGSVTELQEKLKDAGIRSKQKISAVGRKYGGAVLSRGTLYHLLNSQVYIGKTTHKDKLYPGKHEAIVDQSIWEQASRLLKNNGVTRRRTRNLPSSRMLHGKLMAESGQHYTPTHAAKGGRRYFYYTLTKEYGAGNSIKRLPAVEIENRVAASVSAFLSNTIQVAEHFQNMSVRDLKLLTSSAAHQAAVLADGSGQQKNELMRKLVSRVVVSTSALHVRLDRTVVRCQDSIETNLNYSEPIELSVPFQVARRGSEVRLILTSNAQSAERIPSLVRAVVQTRRWYDWIIRGEVRTMRELAMRASLDRHYASRILRLVTLAPELADAILKGEHSPVLTVAQLTDRLPLDWSEQQIKSFC